MKREEIVDLIKAEVAKQLAQQSRASSRVFMPPSPEEDPHTPPPPPPPAK
jgi:hypothetical protein